MRLLTTLAGAVEQLFLYDAYGADLAIFNAASGAFSRVAADQAKTPYRHDGEYFERETGAKYLRDRRQIDGRFSTLDRYSGDDYSPLSLHKYLFTSGDPANGIDPSGLFTITQQMAVTAIRGVLTNMALGAVQGFVTSPAISFLFGERNANRLLADAVEGAKVGAVAGGISFGVGGALAPVGKVLVATYGRTAIRTLGPAVTRYLFTGVMSGANGAITGAAVGGINAWWEDGEAQEIAFAAFEGGYVGSVLGLGAGLGSGAWGRYSFSRVASVASTVRGILTAAASRARSMVGPGRGDSHGTRVHSAFAKEVNRLGNPELRTEVSYRNGQVVPYGTPGSVRVDVVEGSLSAPSAVYDLKTGAATLTLGRVKQIQQHVPGGSSVPVIEIR